MSNNVWCQDSFIKRKNKIINILESFKDEKYALMLIGYLMYIPDDLISIMWDKLCYFSGFPDDEKFNKIISYMENRMKEGK